MTVEKTEPKGDKTSKGLEGVVALESGISSIIGSTLTYRGIDIDELALSASYEEVVYLLWFAKLPNRKELDEFCGQLRAGAAVPNEVFEAMARFPKNNHPMDGLRTAVSLLGLYDPDTADMSKEANLRKATRLTAQVPVLVAALSLLYNDRKPIAPREDLNIAANFIYMLTGKEPDDVATKAIDTALVLHADHELNASTFAARETVSTLSDMHSGVISAIATLKGPLHGGANEAVMRMLLEIGDYSKVDQFISDALSGKKKIMGFGHRVYKNGDPRAKHLRRMSEEIGKLKGETKWYEMSARIDDIVTKEKGLLPNVDFYSASTYYMLGLPIDLFTPVFASSRISGWLAHIMEQYADNRLIRPRADYTGPVDQHYIPVEKRG
jgi:citrate synthase